MSNNETTYSVLSNLNHNGTLYEKGQSVALSDEETINPLLQAGVICLPGDEPKATAEMEGDEPVAEQNTWQAQPDPVETTEDVPVETSTTPASPETTTEDVPTNL